MESRGMESLWATLKKELVHDRHFRTHDEAHTAIFEWIEVWYQRIRIHGSLGYVSPEAFKATERIVLSVHDECAGPSRQFLQANTPGRQLHRIITASAD